MSLKGQSGASWQPLVADPSRSVTALTAQATAHGSGCTATLAIHKATWCMAWCLPPHHYWLQKGPHGCS